MCMHILCVEIFCVTTDMIIIYMVYASDFKTAFCVQCT